MTDLIITEAHFPGGVLCECGTALLEGDSYSLRLDSMVGDLPLTRIVCPECGEGAG